MHLLSDEAILLTARPSKRVSYGWLFSKALPLSFYLTVFVGLGWIMFNSPPERGQPAPYSLRFGLAVVGGFFLLALAASYAYMVALAKTFEYTITSHRFMFSGGILRRVRHAVEHRRVTDVQLS